MVDEEFVNKFISICDDALYKSPIFLNTEQLSEYLEIREITNISSSKFIGEFLKEKILCESGVNFLGKLKSAIYRREILLNISFKYSFIVESLHYFLGNRAIKSLEEIRDWENIIEKIILLSPYIDINHLHPSEEDEIVIGSALFLINKGYEIGIDGGNFSLKEDVSRSIALKIDEMARSIGGKRMINFLFKEMRRRGWDKNGRYSIPSQEAIYPAAKKSASLPIGYILNLCAKNLKFDPIHVTNDLIDDFIGLCIAYTSIYDVEVFNAWSLSFIDHRSLPNYIRKANLRETFFSFKQLAPNDCILYLENLYSWVNNDLLKIEMGWDLHDFNIVAKLLINPKGHDGITQLFSAEDICRVTKLNKYIVEKILDSITHKTFDINSEFLFPHDSRKINLHHKPLVWQRGGNYLVLEPALASIGLITSLNSILRKIDPDADSKVGDSIEKFLFDCFNKAHIEATLYSKKYKIKNQEFECDVVLENEDKIVFIESKKKSITAAALSGDSANAIVDLSLSFFSAQKQILNHQLNILKNKEIKFLDGTSLNIKNNLDGISVSLFDWGVLQNRVISKSILQNFLGKAISAPDFEDQNKIIRCNKIIDDVTKLRNKIIEISEDKDPIYDFVFLGVPQILHMIRLSNSKSDFFDNFAKFKTCIVSGVDTYGALSYINQLKKYEKEKIEA